MKCYPCTAGANLLRVIHTSPRTTIPRGVVGGRVGSIPDSKVHGANMGPIWGRQDPGGPHVGPVNFAIWDMSLWKLSLHVFTHFTETNHFPQQLPHNWHFAESIRKNKSSKYTCVDTLSMEHCAIICFFWLLVCWVGNGERYIKLVYKMNSIPLTNHGAF